MNSHKSPLEAVFSHEPLMQKILALLDFSDLISISLANTFCNNIIETSYKLQLQQKFGFVPSTQLPSQQQYETFDRFYKTRILKWDTQGWDVWILNTFGDLRNENLFLLQHILPDYGKKGVIGAQFHLAIHYSAIHNWPTLFDFHKDYFTSQRLFDFIRSPLSWESKIDKLIQEKNEKAPHIKTLFNLLLKHSIDVTKHNIYDIFRVTKYMLIIALQLDPKLSQEKNRQLAETAVDYLKKAVELRCNGSTEIACQLFVLYRFNELTLKIWSQDLPDTSYFPVPQYSFDVKQLLTEKECIDLLEAGIEAKEENQIQAEANKFYKNQGRKFLEAISKEKTLHMNTRP